MGHALFQVKDECKRLPVKAKQKESLNENNENKMNFDDPPEYCSHVDHDQPPPDDYPFDFPPEDRISNLGPEFWNGFLRGWVPFDVDDENKENIYAFVTDGAEKSQQIDSNLANLHLEQMTQEK